MIPGCRGKTKNNILGNEELCRNAELFLYTKNQRGGSEHEIGKWRHRKAVIHLSPRPRVRGGPGAAKG
jgi:hypothetical protein